MFTPSNTLKTSALFLNFSLENQPAGAEVTKWMKNNNNFLSSRKIHKRDVFQMKRSSCTFTS
jgi:hypothetical protein